LFFFFFNSKVAKSFYNKIIRTLLFLLAVDLSNCSLTLVKSKFLDFEKDNGVAKTNTNTNSNNHTTTHSEGSIIDTENNENIDDANIDDDYEADVSDYETGVEEGYVNGDIESEIFTSNNPPYN
jgi:hypothetical protein